jgi:hypothetical protein
MIQRACSVFFALAALLPAQQSKVIPSGMDNVEGPLVYTYPFGRVDGGLCILYDADQITTTSNGVILGVNFRPSQQTQTALGYTKPYRVTMYTVPMTAAQMMALGSPVNPAVIIGTAVPTVVFNGPVTLPSIGPLATAPGAFNINIPFTTPYLFDGTQGNLFMMLETTDTTPVTTTYRIDAVLFRNTVAEGIAADIDTLGCAAAGATVGIATSSASSIIGSSIDTTITPSAGGIFSLALAALSFERADIPLATFGLPGCTSRLGLNLVTQALIDTGAGFPHATWAVPAVSAYTGLQVFTQVVALPAAGSGMAVSNGQAIRIGSNAPAPVKAMMAFRSSTTWSQGQAGEFVAVVRFDGVFP